MSRSRMPVLAIAITAVLSVAACGGGTTTGSGGASSPAPVEATPAASGGAGGAVCATSTGAGTVQAGMSGVAFVPATIQAKVGDVIAWTNNDTVPHTATFKDDPACSTETLAAGASGALTFSAAGTYALICKIHSSMSATVEVTE
jgi:plastocyanin